VETFNFQFPLLGSHIGLIKVDLKKFIFQFPLLGSDVLAFSMAVSILDLSIPFIGFKSYII